MELNKILLGDCVEVMKTLPDNSVDSIVTDPPYGLGFMGKEWDTFDKSQFGQKGLEGKNDLKVKKNFNILPRIGEGKALQEFTLLWAKEALRVLKSGGYLLSFGGSRTYHRMAVAIEDAGFEIRDMVEWVYGSGFPKSLNIGKKNKQWEGWGTALKPSHEPICMARKPLSEKTVAENVLKWGVGGINIDRSRVEMTQEDKKESYRKPLQEIREGFVKTPKPEYKPIGRFPANLIHDGSKEVVEMFPKVSNSNSTKRNRKTLGSFGMPNDNTPEYSDKGSAARFFYCAKASKSERDRGLENVEKKEQSGSYQFGIDSSLDGKPTAPRRNNHPTVKPIALMKYLIKMVTPPKGIVLDPFTGSGSTLIAAKEEGFNFIGIEKEADYVKIAEARVESVEVIKQENLF